MSAATYTAWPEPTVRAEPHQLAPGEHGRIVVTVAVPDGCHVQSHTPTEPFMIPTTLEFDDIDGVVFGPARYPDGEIERFDWSPVELEVYRGTVEIVVPVEVGAGVPVGTTTISGRVRYQGCTETACLPPVELPVRVDAEIVDSHDVVGLRGIV